MEVTELWVRVRNGEGRSGQNARQVCGRRHEYQVDEGGCRVVQDEEGRRLRRAGRGSRLESRTGGSQCIGRYGRP